MLFDLDDTLLDRDTSIERFITAQHHRLAIHLSPVAQTDYVTRFIQLDRHGDGRKEQAYQALVAEFAIQSISWQELLQDYETQFQFSCVPFWFLSQTLSQLKQDGYLLGIVTNGLERIQNRSIDSLGIRGYFDAILISEVEQVRKPQPEIFHRAVERLGVSPQETIFVGDNPTSDILGAKNAGMKAIWKRDSYWLETVEADATIDELNEIPSLIEQLSHTSKEP